MTKSGLPPLRKEFWNVNKRLLKISSSGRIYYTEEGKTQYRSLFLRHGYILENVNTLADFRRVMQDITAIQLEQPNDELLRLIHDPQPAAIGCLGPADTAVARVGGMPHPSAPRQATVVSLAEWRERKGKD